MWRSETNFYAFFFLWTHKAIFVCFWFVHLGRSLNALFVFIIHFFFSFMYFAHHNLSRIERVLVSSFVLPSTIVTSKTTTTTKHTQKYYLKKKNTYLILCASTTILSLQPNFVHIFLGAGSIPFSFYKCLVWMWKLKIVIKICVELNEQKREYRNKKCCIKMPSIECAICSEEFGKRNDNDSAVVVTPCGHVFHLECLSKWLQYG